MDKIIKELHALKLSGMARLWASLNETKRLDKLTLVDGLMLLLQQRGILAPRTGMLAL